MALSTVIKTNRDGSLQGADGTGTPLTANVTFENGDVTITGIASNLNEVVAIESRGRFNTIRHAARTYPEITFSAKVADLSEATTGVFQDLVLGTGAHSARVSTLGSSRQEITLDLTLTIEGTDHGDAADQTIVLNDVFITFDFAESPESNALSFKGTVYGAITGDLAASEL